jgi:hypothetical protein
VTPEFNAPPPLKLEALLLTARLTPVNGPPVANAGELDSATAPTVNVDITAAAANNRGTFLKDLVISMWWVPSLALRLPTPNRR